MRACSPPGKLVECSHHGGGQASSPVSPFDYVTILYTEVSMSTIRYAQAQPPGKTSRSGTAHYTCVRCRRVPRMPSHLGWVWRSPAKTNARSLLLRTPVNTRNYETTFGAVGRRKVRNAYLIDAAQRCVHVSVPAHDGCRPTTVFRSGGT